MSNDTITPQAARASDSATDETTKPPRPPRGSVHFLLIGKILTPVTRAQYIRHVEAERQRVGMSAGHAIPEARS